MHERNQGRIEQRWHTSIKEAAIVLSTSGTMALLEVDS
jgi:hypothetical protein